MSIPVNEYFVWMKRLVLMEGLEARKYGYIYYHAYDYRSLKSNMGRLILRWVKFCMLDATYTLCITIYFMFQDTSSFDTLLDKDQI